LAGPGDPVGLGDAIGLDGPESLPQVLASLPQQLERVAGSARRSGALRISPVFLNEVSLECRRDFVRRLQRVVDGPVPCSVVNHAASIAQWVPPPHDPLKLAYSVGSTTESTVQFYRLSRRYLFIFGRDCDI